MPKIAIVHKDRCNPQGCGGYLCIRVCPVNRMGKEHITIDPFDKKIRINPELTGFGCAIEANRCPFSAIELINLPEELAQQPIHQYGLNGFHLFRLPMPVFGKVLGIIGQNGIGKSSCLRILAGILQPNLGKEKASLAQLLEHFKGTEAQPFFQALAEKKITASFKPQQVDLIPKQFKGKLIDFLKKFDQKGQMHEVVEKLGLTPLLERQMDVLSGGELQRAAIAAASLKAANLYLFDEPTNFLDIKERLVVANFISSLATPSAVVVADHDLLILDSMVQLVHILYGKAACYGLVSHPMAVRTGINTYLSGYIREEKMKFRQSEIRFETKPPVVKREGEEITSWAGLSKKLGEFVLKTGQGKIFCKEVIGVVGENGIGKTTFAKILAGQLEPDSGELHKKVTIGYKPQYLETNSEELVGSILEEAVVKYENELIKPLELKWLLGKPLNELSGGELQRVAIAHCLSHEAKLYLLDEPSAYLDVEQRLAVARLIRDVAEKRECAILVIDHDLMFIDYVSNRLMVFNGNPGISGLAEGPFDMENGMNAFLSSVGITIRRDLESKRPRINKPGSRLDREQKASGKYYYS
ncbi:MAG: ribosome biogenesis/translation initiation ATPase RLI [Candidatus Woesearchaeota archaeon]